MASVSIIWHTMGDDRVCPICKAINGYVWTFDIAESLPTTLTHPEYDIVWDVAFGSEAHARHRMSCRCWLSADWDLKDLIAKLTSLRDMMLQSSIVKEPAI